MTGGDGCCGSSICSGTACCQGKEGSGFARYTIGSSTPTRRGIGSRCSTPTRSRPIFLPGYTFSTGGGGSSLCRGTGFSHCPFALRSDRRFCFCRTTAFGRPRRRGWTSNTTRFSYFSRTSGDGSRRFLFVNIGGWSGSRRATTRFLISSIPSCRRSALSCSRSWRASFFFLSGSRTGRASGGWTTDTTSGGPIGRGTRRRGRLGMAGWAGLTTVRSVTTFGSYRTFS